MKLKEMINNNNDDDDEGEGGGSGVHDCNHDNMTMTILQFIEIANFYFDWSCFRFDCLIPKKNFTWPEEQEGRGIKLFPLHKVQTMDKAVKFKNRIYYVLYVI